MIKQKSVSGDGFQLGYVMIKRRSYYPVNENTVMHITLLIITGILYIMKLQKT
jgi:hypothetical protein